MKINLLYGVGVNDSKTPVYKSVGKKRVMCPYYRKWSSMIERCYSERYIKIRPRNSETKVCEEWLTFSNFKGWMETQDWEGKQLDKDLLGDGTMYSPETCCFLTQKQNGFISERLKHKGLPKGVYRYKNGRISAAVSNPLVNRLEFIGYFNTVEEANSAYLYRKIEIGLVLFDGCPENQIKALVSKYTA